MGKFRTKAKGASKGKRWRKGQSSSSNPSITKFRDKAKSKFFHENLGADSGLTSDALKKHNAIHLFGHGLGDVTKKLPTTATIPTESEYSIAKSFEDISLKDDGISAGEGSESSVATFKTFQTFASDWSACSNASFTRLLRGFDPKCALHKEMLAILAAITEVIKEKGGSETSTEYYAALMETLKASEGDEGVCATISLLSMGLKSVPRAVLRVQFSDAMEIFMDLLEKYSDSDHNVILRCIIGCLSVFLRAQDYATWSDSSTLKVFDSLLAFTLHSKPKIRKAAQHAVCAILRGSSFMLPSEDDPNHKIPSLHPASNRVAIMCKSQMKGEMLSSNHTTVLHTLTLLKEVIALFSKEYIKSSCESLLSLMTQNDIIIKTWCLRVLHSLFSEPGSTSHLTAQLVLQLVRALTACRPNAADPRQTLAWVTVMQQAFVCLASLDMKTCMTSLPMFVHVCVTELWLSDKIEITSAASNALKIVLVDCVKPAAETEESSKEFWNNIESIFKSIKTGLDNPFNQSTKHVVLTIAVCFEVGNEGIKNLLAPLLIHLNERRESHNFTLQKEMEYATGCAVKHLGPAFVLQCIPLRSSATSINLDRSWLLPILKNNVKNSTLEYFSKDILELASLCKNTAKAANTNNDTVNSHTYDLLCTQLWSLLPNFCTNPSDISANFKGIARILGNVLKDNSDYRPCVMQGVRKLIHSCEESQNEEDKAELARFAKNFLPLLLNIYMTPAKNSTAEGQRLAALETIQVYLNLSPTKLQVELFQNALTQLEGIPEANEDYFKKECLLDILRVLVLHQDVTNMTSLFEKWVYPLCEADSEKLKTSVKKEAKKKDDKTQKMETEENGTNEKAKLKEKLKMIDLEHKKAYRILEEIFKSEKENCKLFLVENRKKIQKMLVQSLNKEAPSSKGTRLRCIQFLIKSQPNLDQESKLIKSALPEAVVCTRDINSKCRQTAFDLINTIGEVLQTKKNGLDNFVILLEAGLNGPFTISMATIWSLASATYNFSASLGIENLQRIFEKICDLIKSANRQIVAACLAFLKVYTKSLPAPFVAGSLPLIFRSIADMTDDCKRHARTDLSNLLTKLVRKFGSDTISRLVPESDEGLHKKLRYMRKMDNRKKRQKELGKVQRDENDSDEEIQVRGSSMTLEEILKDSDSELDFGEEEDEYSKKNKKTKMKNSKKTSQAWIREDPDNIIDLMDPSSAKNITASKPSFDSVPGGSEIKVKKKKKEIKTTPDGKLILDFGNNDSDSDENRGTKRKKNSDDSDDSDSDDGLSAAETMLLSAGKKRKYDDIKSTKSGKSGFSVATSKYSKYKTGGKGIHRNTAASVKSQTGSEYRAKKAKGDVKKKGMPDPYAYVPLARNALNKRKKLKHQKQFVNVMKGAKKGAAVGRITKNKMRMKSKK